MQTNSSSDRFPADLIPARLGFDDPQMQALRTAMSQASRNLEQAQLRYQHSLEAATGEGFLNSDCISALQKAGREYAVVVTEFSRATMAWLSSVDRTR